MSTPAFDLGALFSALLNAITSAVQTVINVITANIGTIVNVALVGLVVGGAFMLMRRYVGNITRWFTGLFRL